MIKVHVWFHKDGDHLVIAHHPWWNDIYEWLVKRICPCCGWRGWLASKFEWFSTYTLWNYLLNVTYKHEMVLFKVPVESGCQASQAIWGKKTPCWHDNCEHCWEYREDAHVEEYR